MNPSLPVILLTILGTVITVLGIFAAGDILVASVGLAALIAAALIGAYESKVQSSSEIAQPAFDRE